MVLLGRTLFRMLEEGTLSITPLDKEQVQPASVDICLGDTFSIMENLSTGIITLKGGVRYKTIDTDTYIPLPGQFVPVATMEYISLPNDLIASAKGRSSLGCLGLFVQNTDWVDPGFQGGVTLELSNVNRCVIELKARRRVDQLVFAEMDDIIMRPYDGKYQGQRGATGSRIYMD